MAQNIGGRATCIGLLDMADHIFEDEENVEHFHLMQVFCTRFQYSYLRLIYLSRFKISTRVFEGGALEPLYKSLQP